MSHQHVRETAKDGKQCSLEVLPRTAVINGPLVWTPGALIPTTIRNPISDHSERFLTGICGKYRVEDAYHLT